MMFSPHQQTNLFPLSGRFSVSTTLEMQKNLIDMINQKHSSKMRSSASVATPGQQLPIKQNQSQVFDNNFKVVHKVNFKPSVNDFLGSGNLNSLRRVSDYANTDTMMTSKLESKARR